MDICKGILLDKVVSLVILPHKMEWRSTCTVCDEIRLEIYEGWNFNNGNYLFTTDTK